MKADNPLLEYLLRLGDNCLILGHRLSEWVSHSPAIEEELAVANVALDLIGQGRLWLTLAGQVEGKGRDEDKLAYLRDAGEFRNLLLVEQPNGDFAQTMARQFYFDAWHYLLLRELTQCKDARVAEIAAKALKEVTYHLRRSSDWVTILGDGTDESHRRIQATQFSPSKISASLTRGNDRSSRMSPAPFERGRSSESRALPATARRSLSRR